MNVPVAAFTSEATKLKDERVSLSNNSCPSPVVLGGKADWRRAINSAWSSGIFYLSIEEFSIRLCGGDG